MGDIPQNWEELECGNVDCISKKHWYPKDGVQVRLKKDTSLRQPGTDDTYWQIKAYEFGVVEIVEPSFHQAVVVFPRERKVWADISELWTEKP